MRRHSCQLGLPALGSSQPSCHVWRPTAAALEGTAGPVSSIGSRAKLYSMQAARTPATSNEERKRTAHE